MPGTRGTPPDAIFAKGRRAGGASLPPPPRREAGGGGQRPVAAIFTVGSHTSSCRWPLSMAAAPGGGKGGEGGAGLPLRRERYPGRGWGVGLPRPTSPCQPRTPQGPLRGSPLAVASVSVRGPPGISSAPPPPQVTAGQRVWSRAPLWSLREERYIKRYIKLLRQVDVTPGSDTALERISN